MDQFHETRSATPMRRSPAPVAARQMNPSLAEPTARARQADVSASDRAHGERTARRRQRSIRRKIRVLLVITGLASGGATNVVLDLARYFKRHPDFKIDLVTGPPPPGRTDVTHVAHELGVNPEVVPSLVNHINPLLNVKAIVRLWRLMLQGKYDIVHTHSSVAGVIGRVAAFSARVPAIVHHVHGWGLKASGSRSIRTLYLKLEQLCARFTDKLIAVSTPDIEQGLAHRIASEKQFALIYNGINLAKFRQPVAARKMRHELGLDPASKLVGMIGRLDRQKNPLDFIRAAAIVSRRYPDVQFLIIGDGSLRTDCERLIAEFNLEGKLFLLGYRDDVAKILPILTMTVMSSLWEGLPIAFLEAMSAGKPIVANDVDGASDVVIDGQTGFLVPPRQPLKMAERILCLLENEALCREMGEFAQQRSDYFSVERMTGEMESMYRELHSRR